jgi:hypothetical protein
VLNVDRVAKTETDRNVMKTNSIDTLHVDIAEDVRGSREEEVDGAVDEGYLQHKDLDDGLVQY